MMLNAKAAPMSTRVFGKWILVGEHAVLRGVPALVFPFLARSLQLSFTPGDKLLVQIAGDHQNAFSEIFLRCTEGAVHLLPAAKDAICGQFKIENSLPLGAGLGASAALCVALGRWFCSQGFLSEAEIYEFSRQLENIFHGESSGVDVAVALSGKGLKFERGGARVELSPVWKPHCYLSHSGAPGITSECVAKVKAIFVSDQNRALQLDEQMRKASHIAESALLSTDGFAKLKQAVELAAACFDSWGLTEGHMGEHLQALRKAGAAASKPTGSGQGGYALSLWSSAPSDLLREQLGLLPAF